MNRRRKYRLVGLFLAGTIGVAGCDRGPRAPAGPPPDPAATPAGATPAPPAPAPGTLEVVDGLGRKVVLARPARRIVALAPSNTEMLFALGAGDRVVGRTTADSYPPAAMAIAPVGGMTPKAVNLEAIVALQPDLVLATCGVQEPIVAPLERLGLAVVALDADDFEGVARNLRVVGQLIGNQGEADRLADRFLGRVRAVGERVARRAGPPPRVLYLVSEDPLMTAGPRTFIGEMIRTAGGVNVFGDVATRYPRPSEEEILARAPDVILTSIGAMNAGPADVAARRARIEARPGWAQIPAVRAGRIATLPEDEMSRPGPRLVDGLEAVADALDPK